MSHHRRPVLHLRAGDGLADPDIHQLASGQSAVDGEVNSARTRGRLSRPTKTRIAQICSCVGGRLVPPCISRILHSGPIRSFFSPYYLLGRAAKGTVTHLTFKSCRARKLARPVICVLADSESERAGDAIVANRLRRQALHQRFHAFENRSFHHRNLGHPRP